MDAQLQNLTLGLMKFSHNLPSVTEVTGPYNVGPRIQTLETRLMQIRDSLPLPPNSVSQVNQALSQLGKLRWVDTRLMLMLLQSPYLLT